MEVYDIESKSATYVLVEWKANPYIYYTLHHDSKQGRAYSVCVGVYAWNFYASTTFYSSSHPFFPLPQNDH